MSRPERVNEDIKGNALNKLQKEKIQTMLDSSGNKPIEARITIVKEYLSEKKLPFLGVRMEDVLGRNRIAVHFKNTSYYFNPEPATVWPAKD